MERKGNVKVNFRLLKMFSKINLKKIRLFNALWPLHKLTWT